MLNKKLVGLEFGNIRSSHFVKMPTALLSLWLTGTHRFFCRIGRLYAGYIGVFIIIWRFQFNLWIHNIEH